MVGNIYFWYDKGMNKKTGEDEYRVQIRRFANSNPIGHGSGKTFEDALVAAVKKAKDKLGELNQL